MSGAGRVVVPAALPFAIATVLILSPAPALCGATGATLLGGGATSFGDAVLPPLPPLPNAAAAPEIEWVPPARSGATTATQPAPASLPESAGAGAGASEAGGEPASPAEQLAAARRAAIDAARQAQEAERAVAAIRHEIDLLGSAAKASRQRLTESRDEQARLLGAILHLAHNPAGGRDRDASLVDRLRGEALMREVDPALRAQLVALTGQITRLDALRKRIDAENAEADAARRALASARERLAAAVARRTALLIGLSPPQGIDAALRIADAEREAKNLGELIKRAEAAGENDDRQRQRSRTGAPRNKPAALSRSDDPTRPGDLRSLAQESGTGEAEPTPSAGSRQAETDDAAPSRALLVPPVAGASMHTDGAPGAPAPGGLGLEAVPGATIVAPFDGKIVYAAPFRDLGGVLIIRHDRRYYSALAGLGRIDAKVGDWVLAGEPVGAMRDTPYPGADAREFGDSNPGGPLYYVLFRDGSPVDPQPWLAMSGAGPASETGSGR